MDEDDADVLDAICALRPMFPVKLETENGDVPQIGTRPFHTLSDLALAGAAIEKIGAASSFYKVWACPPVDPAPRTTAEASEGVAPTAGLWRTALAAKWTKGPEPHGIPLPGYVGCRPSGLRRRLGRPHPARASAENTGRLAGQNKGLSEAARSVAARWLESLAAGAEVLGPEGPTPLFDV